MVAALLSATAAWAVDDAAAASARHVGALIDAGQQRAVLERYFGCGTPPGVGYAAIARGNAAWVALAERVLEFSDACYTEGIQSALGSAMRVAPRAVLPLVDKSALLAADRICLPFISDEQTPQAQLAELRRSKTAVQRVHGSPWASGRAACLRSIDAVEVAVKTR